MGIQEWLIYWQVIKKRLWLIGLLAGVTLGTVLLVSYLSAPVYRATASFRVAAPLPGEVSLFSEFRTSSTREELNYTKSNFIAVLQSESIVGQVIEELGLKMSVQEFMRAVVIEPDENSDLVQLRVTAHDPGLAAAMANAIVSDAARRFGELSAGSITANKEFIQRQLQEVTDDLEQARAALIQFQVENAIGSPDQAFESQEYLITALKSSQDRALVEQGEEAALSYDEIVAEREREFQEIILLNAEYEVLRDTVSRIKEVHTNLMEKETEAELKENEVISARFIQVIPARVPSSALPRLNIKILALAGAVSLCLGVMLAFILEYLDRAAVELGKEDTIHARRGIGMRDRVCRMRLWRRITGTGHPLCDLQDG
jgi:capsular polysaccharide biosynthesis protein